MVCTAVMALVSHTFRLPSASQLKKAPESPGCHCAGVHPCKADVTASVRAAFTASDGHTAVASPAAARARHGRARGFAAPE